jgi:ribose 5-phosphate isomerase A
MTAAERALELINDGCVVGLGTGRAATAFLHAVAARCKAGLRVRGVATSQATAQLAVQLGVPLVTLDEIESIDIAVDGADEVDPDLNLIKGYGGALVREKIVAAASKRLVILVTPDKLVPVLGTRAKLPVEVVPFGLPVCSRRLHELGCPPTTRTSDGVPFVTDNGNRILDCAVRPISNPAEFERQIRSIPGVVDTGLFLGLADIVFVQDGDEVQVRERQAPHVRR